MDLQYEADVLKKRGLHEDGYSTFLRNVGLEIQIHI
jgi:hypothetical protein